MVTQMGDWAGDTDGGWEWGMVTQMGGGNGETDGGWWRRSGSGIGNRNKDTKKTLDQGSSRSTCSLRTKFMGAGITLKWLR